jgi:predicted secreted hydrolase
VLTEWWYYTGHLVTGDGLLYGFEQVTFKARRNALAGLAAHVAITDRGRRRFRYDQRAVLDNGSIANVGNGFDLTIGDWSMRGANGIDELAMSIPGYAGSLHLTSQKPAVLHGGDGYFRTGAGAGSYYYSRTRMSVDGTLGSLS